MEITALEEDVQRSEAEKEKTAVGEADKEGSSEAQVDRKGKGKEKREVSAAVILQQLQLLRGDLHGLTPNVEGVLEANGEKEDDAKMDGPLAQRAQASASLLSKLGAPEPALTPAAAPLLASSSQGHPALSEEEEGEMEKRIARLEELLGASEAGIDEVRTTSRSTSFADQ